MDTVFDSLGYYERLKDVGVDEKAAKVHAETLRATIEGSLTTKQDLKELEYKFETKIEKMKNEVIIKLGSVTVVCTTIAIGILAIILK